MRNASKNKAVDDEVKLTKSIEEKIQAIKQEGKAFGEKITLHAERSQLLIDQQKEVDLMTTGGSKAVGAYYKELDKKALQQLLDEGQLTPKDAEKLKEIISNRYISK